MDTATVVELLRRRLGDVRHEAGRDVPREGGASADLSVVDASDAECRVVAERGANDRVGDVERMDAQRLGREGVAAANIEVDSVALHNAVDEEALLEADAELGMRAVLEDGRHRIRRRRVAAVGGDWRGRRRRAARRRRGTTHDDAACGRVEQLQDGSKVNWSHTGSTEDAEQRLVEEVESRARNAEGLVNLLQRLASVKHHRVRAAEIDIKELDQVKGEIGQEPLVRREQEVRANRSIEVGKCRCASSDDGIDGRIHDVSDQLHVGQLERS